MKTFNIFFDFEFTSLSPDAQPISLGMVAEVEKTLMPPCDVYSETVIEDKTFYAEFSDFDINRCDDWAKENVVNRLRFNKYDEVYPTLGENGSEIKHNTSFIEKRLREWLAQFKDYQIQFVGDCVTFDWYWMLQLLGKWKTIENEEGFTGVCHTCGQKGIMNYHTGLPILPDNISPIPQDLNDLISYKKGISIKESFELDRDELHFSLGTNQKLPLDDFTKKVISSHVPDKHNSLSDAKVTKTIFNYLKQTKRKF